MSQRLSPGARRPSTDLIGRYDMFRAAPRRIG
jgi:hypothetical protein